MGCTQSAPEALGARAIEIERAKALFVKFDEDNSGSIDSEELINLLSDLRGVEVSASTVAMLIEKYDKNNDGTLQLSEFMPMALHLFNITRGFEVDSNLKHAFFGDGKLGLQLRHSHVGMVVISIDPAFELKNVKVGDALTQMNGYKLANMLEKEWHEDPTESVRMFNMALGIQERPMLLSFMPKDTASRKSSDCKDSLVEVPSITFVAADAEFDKERQAVVAKKEEAAIESLYASAEPSCLSPSWPNRARPSDGGDNASFVAAVA